MSRKQERELSDVERIYEDVRRRVRRKYDRRSEIVTHTIVCFLVLGFGWFALFAGILGYYTPRWVFLIAAIISVSWIIGLFIHAIQTLFEEMQDRAIEREFQREMALRGYVGKHKNDAYFDDTPAERLVGLSEDGEIVDIDEIVEKRRR